MENEENNKIPFTAHLEELRKRLIICFIAIGVGFIISYSFKKDLFDLLVLPLVSAMNQGEVLIYTSLPEAFFTFIKVSFISSLMISFPLIIYQFWAFVAPGLYRNERRLLFYVTLLSSVFFIGGSLFGYFVVFPIGFKFFLSFASDSMKPLPSVKEYLSFSSRLLFAFGIVFELPLIITFLSRFGILSVDFLKKNRKYAILLFFAGAALLTPPDVVTQIMMALPLMVLYEISIIGARVFTKNKES